MMAACLDMLQVEYLEIKWAAEKAVFSDTELAAEVVVASSAVSKVCSRVEVTAVVWDYAAVAQRVVSKASVLADCLDYWSD